MAKHITYLLNECKIEMEIYYINVRSGKRVFYSKTINKVFLKNNEYMIKEKGFFGDTNFLNLINFYAKEIGCVIVLKRP